MATWLKKDAWGSIVEDIVPEDMSLKICTEKGLVLPLAAGIVESSIQ